VAYVPAARHLLRAKDLADARYFEPLSVADLAAAAGLSPAHFSRQFKAAFGESPHQYLLTRRLERAAALLRATDWTVAAVCFAVGAQSVGSFTASFHRVFGLSPLAYRAAYPPAEQHLRIPRCVALAYGRPQNRTFREDKAVPGSLALTSGNAQGGLMIKIANAQFWVTDQDAALEFYTKKLGWEVRSDVTMEAWSFRWLCVGPAGQDGVGLVLMPVPGPPMLDGEASAKLSELVAKGAGGTLFLETDDCKAAYDELSERGVVFNDPPTSQAYGIDTSFRDPSGNNVRLTQVLEFDPNRG
jgi:AraC-like DNA-binding protein/catechol 2,3-dioxygenase-like lactoylglutathione lyase family enzyme